MFLLMRVHFPPTGLRLLPSNMRQLLAAGLALLAGAVLLIYTRRRTTQLADRKYETATDGKALCSSTASDDSKLIDTTTTGGGKLASGLSTIQEGTERGSSTASPSADWR